MDLHDDICAQWSFPFLLATPTGACIPGSTRIFPLPSGVERQNVSASPFSRIRYEDQFALESRRLNFDEFDQ